MYKTTYRYILHTYNINRNTIVVHRHQWSNCMFGTWTKQDWQSVSRHCQAKGMLWHAFESTSRRWIPCFFIRCHCSSFFLYLLLPYFHARVSHSFITSVVPLTILRFHTKFPKIHSDKIWKSLANILHLFSWKAGSSFPSVQCGLEWRLLLGQNGLWNLTIN